MTHLFCCALGVTGLVLLAGCDASGPAEASSRTQAAAARDADVPQVEVAAVGEQIWPEVVRVQGTLWGDETAEIGTRLAGEVAELFVDIGTRVVAGDRLARLDDSEIRLQVQQARAQMAEACASVGMTITDSLESLEKTKSPIVLMEKALLDQSQSNLERAMKLFRSNAITDEQVERLRAEERVAHARYDAALHGVDEKVALIAVRKAALDLAEQNLVDTTIVAPMSGIVQMRHVATGAFVQSGDAVVTIVRVNPMRFRCNVPERKATGIRVGQSVRIRIEGEGVPRTAKVSRVSPQLDLTSRALPIEADLENPDGRLQGGLFAEAEIVTEPDARRLAIPVSAVSEFAGVLKVWVVEDEIAAARRVQLGREVNGFVEIKSGLEVGEVIVIDHRNGQAGPIVSRDHEATFANEAG